MTRFWRRKLRIVSLALITLVLVAASVMQSTSADLLRQTLDANWRGSYDILVTADGQSPLTGADPTLLPASALTDASLGHIPTGLAGQVATVDGVEVAAPIGEVSTPTAGTAKVTLAIPLDGSATGPRAYRVDTSLRLDDGVSAAHTEQNSVDLIVDQSAWPGFQTETPETAKPPRAVTSAGQYSAGAETDASRTVAYYYYDYDNPVQPEPGEGYTAITLPVPTVQTAHLVLVDPVAEKALLGAAGEAMDPLIDTSPLIGFDGTNFYDPANPPVDGDDLLTLHDKGVAARTIPVLARAVDTTPADLTVQLSALDVPSEDLAGALSWNDDGTASFPTTLLQQATADPAQTIYTGQPGEALSPFSFSTVDIDWPGYTMPAQPDWEKYPLFRRAGSPVLTAITPLNITPARGQTGATDQPTTLRATGTDDGELSFNTLGPIPSVEAAGHGPYDLAEVWPVGSFSPDDLAGDDSLGRLGLGYDSADPVLLSGGTAAAGTALPPSWSGLGLNISGALAVAHLANAAYWDIPDPISSIRVRVAGIDDYTAGAQARILDVAEGIRDLGLTATIVAGSSLETVPTRLLGPGTDAAAPGSDSVVALEYSRLGAVAQASQGVSSTNLVLLVMAILAGTALLVAVQLASIAGRRTDSAVLRQIGWPRASIRRWLLTEEIVPLAVLLIVGAVTIALSAVREVTWPTVAIAVGASLGTSALLIWRGSTPPRVARLRRASTRSQRLRTPARVGLREAGHYWGSTVTLALALTLSYLAAATAALVLIAGRGTAGDSRIGSFATAQALLPQGILIVVTVAASCVLIVVIRRLGLDRRTSQLEALHAMGWQRRHLRSAAISEVLSAAIPGGLLGAVLTAVGCAVLLPSAFPAAVAAGATTTIVIVAVVIRVSLRRVVRQPANPGARFAGARRGRAG